MSARQLEACIELGEAIAHGGADLVALDRQSLAARGKGAKRKREGRDCTFPDAKKAQRGVVVGGQRDIRTAMGAPPPPPPTRPKSVVPSPPAAPVDEETAAKITQHPRLTPFRKRVLLALCEVPRGSYTTYLALSDFLDSSPRAVGSALRNNPFAPQVPCHRVVAADGGIGGFGGDWGVTGRHYGEKVRLLKDEGVRVDVGSGKVMGFPWTGFQ